MELLEKLVYLESQVSILHVYIHEQFTDQNGIEKSVLLVTLITKKFGRFFWISDEFRTYRFKFRTQFYPKINGPKFFVINVFYIF